MPTDTHVLESDCAVATVTWERGVLPAQAECRAPLPKERLPSQRAAPEVRRAAAEAAEAERKEKQRSAELEKEQRQSKYWQGAARQAEKELKERGSYQREKSHSQSTRDRYAAEIADVLAEYDEEEVAMLVAAALSKREKATGRGLMLVKQCMVRKHAHLLPATQYAAMRSNVVLQPQASNGGKKRGADSRAPRASMP